ncbi:MAG: matrixin family metalloprotease [Gammaproteobacteria bacterium]
MVEKKKSKHESCETIEGRALYCSLPKVQERDLSHITDGNRLRLIALMEKMWVNGTNLTYFFFKEPAHWRGGSAQEQAVRDAFASWKELGIGLTFQEVDNAADAMIRIGFDQTDGSWSYVGRDCIDLVPDPAKRTTNYGWDLTTPYGRDTALHELGHVMGEPHEHQNPKAGIVWDEEKVYESLGGPPNNWSRDQTYWNIIRKIPANTVDGSEWDKDSIMHYQFEAGLIKEPSEYQTRPLIPASGLSQLDIQTARRLYPPLEERLPELRPFESQRFTIAPGEQVDFVIKPSISREYTLQTFGQMDTVMVLFEIRDDTQEYIDGDDDSGLDYNARIVARLHRNRQYLVRTRLYYARAQGSGAIMLY